MHGMFFFFFATSEMPPNQFGIAFDLTPQHLEAPLSSTDLLPIHLWPSGVSRKKALAHALNWALTRGTLDWWQGVHVMFVVRYATREGKILSWKISFASFSFEISGLALVYSPPPFPSHPFSLQEDTAIYNDGCRYAAVPHRGYAAGVRLPPKENMRWNIPKKWVLVDLIVFAC